MDAELNLCRTGTYIQGWECIFNSLIWLRDFVNLHPFIVEQQFRKGTEMLWKLEPDQKASKLNYRLFLFHWALAKALNDNKNGTVL